MARFHNFKCGEIYITYQGKYSYNCVICREWFDNIEYYEDHYMVQHFESKELYDNDSNYFPIKIEPVTEHDLESIKSEIDSEQDSCTTTYYDKVDIIKEIEYQFSQEDSDLQENELAETNEVIITLQNKDFSQNKNSTEIFDSEVLEWNDSDQKINLEFETENQEEIYLNSENFVENKFLNEKSNIKNRYLTCQICLVKYPNSTFLDHVFQHSENGVCPLCEKSVSNLKKHRIEHENNIKHETNFKFKTTKQVEPRKQVGKRKALSCKYCNKNFFFINVLERHQRLHENRNLNCEFCNKSYRDLRFLKYHKRKHTGERPFKCELCAAAFTTKDNLNTHNIYKHTDTYNFSCTYEDCDKKFKTKELRKRHIKNIHLKVFKSSFDP
ncbi:zinc finger protein 479-like isoform X2 [Condylostylus longicornis]|uniref:zinc finger protein 479-like isoform X2 n=1 Tax=Condylostylus longicornis TaxID=2530218 RepID=UPI00244DA2FA|nr:zinc finger protein 479-like isoform X2 [Condylostylus longicornis]